MLVALIFCCARIKDTNEEIIGFYTLDMDENKSPAIISPDDNSVTHIKRETLEIYMGGDKFMKI